MRWCWARLRFQKEATASGSLGGGSCLPIALCWIHSWQQSVLESATMETQTGSFTTAVEACASVCWKSKVNGLTTAVEATSGCFFTVSPYDLSWYGCGCGQKAKPLVFYYKWHQSTQRPCPCGSALSVVTSSGLTSKHLHKRVRTSVCDFGEFNSVLIQCTLNLLAFFILDLHVVLKIISRAPSILSKCSTTEIRPHPLFTFYSEVWSH